MKRPAVKNAESRPKVIFKSDRRKQGLAISKGRTGTEHSGSMSSAAELIGGDLNGWLQAELDLQGR